MKPFRLKDYQKLIKEGKNPRIVTRENKPIRIIATDRISVNNLFPVVALVKVNDVRENIYSFTENGTYYCYNEHNSYLNLYFADID